MNASASSSQARPVRLFLCGDAMIGRGIDQILPHPSDPLLHESYTPSALDYVRLAEAANGPNSAPSRSFLHLGRGTG